MAKYCSNCGGQLNDGVNFCPSCGTEIQRPSMKEVPVTLNPEGDSSVAQKSQQARTKSPTFQYNDGKRHSEIITKNDQNGEPVVEFRNLHPNAIWLFFFQYIGRSSILLVLFLIGIGGGIVLGDDLVLITSSLIMILYFIVVYVVGTISYKNILFEVTTVSFRKEFGVIHKHTVNIAFDQIQNINMKRSLFDQVLGLAHLEIETAGTSGGIETSVGGLITTAEGYIPGITPEEAKDIKELMLARIQQ